MSLVSIEIASDHMSELVDAALRGEEVILTRDETPVVKLTPVASQKRQPVFGSLKGVFEMADDFDAPLDDFKDYQP